MKRLIALIAVGAVSLILSGCGQQAPKQPEVKTENAATPAENQAGAPAAPEASKPAEPAAPAESAPATQE